jgi:hypothetical protein
MTSTNLDTESRELALDEISLVLGAAAPGIPWNFLKLLDAISRSVPYDIEHGGFHVPS